MFMVGLTHQPDPAPFPHCITRLGDRPVLSEVVRPPADLSWSLRCSHSQAGSATSVQSLLPRHVG